MSWKKRRALVNSRSGSLVSQAKTKQSNLGQFEGKNQGLKIIPHKFFTLTFSLPERVTGHIGVFVF